MCNTRLNPQGAHELNYERFDDFNCETPITDLRLSGILIHTADYTKMETIIEKNVILPNACTFRSMKGNTISEVTMLVLSYKLFPNNIVSLIHTYSLNEWHALNVCLRKELSLNGPIQLCSSWSLPQVY